MPNITRRMIFFKNQQDLVGLSDGWLLFGWLESGSLFLCFLIGWPVDRLVGCRRGMHSVSAMPPWCLVGQLLFTPIRTHRMYLWVTCGHLWYPAWAGAKTLVDLSDEQILADIAWFFLRRLCPANKKTTTISLWGISSSDRMLVVVNRVSTTAFGA